MRLFATVIAVGVLLAVGACRQEVDPDVRRNTSFKASIHYAEVAGSKLAYYTRGEGPALLLAPAWGMTMADWDPDLLALLSAHNRLIIYDLRGVGHSSGDTTWVSIASMADDAVGLLDALQIERANVLGWSMGGFIAQQMAVRHPEKVNKLILAATDAGGKKTADITKRLVSFYSENAAEPWQKLVPTLFPGNYAGRMSRWRYLDRVNDGVTSGEAPDAGLDGSDIKARDVEKGAVAEWATDSSNYRALKQLRAPALIADGSRDALLLSISSQLLARQIPNSELAFYYDSGHAFLFQRRGLFAQRIQVFLDEPPPKPKRSRHRRG